MDWQRKEITKKMISLVLSTLFALGGIGMIIGFLNYNDNPGGALLFLAFFSAFFALIAWSNYRDLKESLEEYKSNKNNDLVETLKRLNPYNSFEAMQTTYSIEKQSPLFADDDFIITKSFLVRSNENSPFVLNCILDAKVVVQKVNGIIDYVTLSILYYDGKKYEFKFNRPLGFSNMQEKVNKIEYVANIIASNSANFRKHPSCRF